MTMHTRYRAAMQQALGDVLLDLLEIVAPADEPSEVGTQALVRLESRRFTLTALPVDGQPTEPTEADPSCMALDEHVGTLRAFVSSVRKFHGECEVSCRPGCAMDVDAAEAVACVLDEIVRLRALVGGRPALFSLGEFTAHSGARLSWKIDCDVLTPADWECLAAMAAEVLPPFGAVEGVPRGGMAFAEALSAHSVPGGRLLIADDVCTTGGSLEDHRAGRDAIGVVAFARGPVPAWVTPLLSVGGRPAAPTREQLRAAVKAGWFHSLAIQNADDREAMIDKVTDEHTAPRSRSAAEPPKQGVPSTPLDIYIGSGVAAEPPDRGEIVERFRKALMRAHANDWDMDTVSEAAHVCAEEVTSWAAR